MENRHQGPGAARNAGVKAAHHVWIAFLDSDDFWEPQKLEEVKWVIEQGKANLIYHNETMLQDEVRTLIDHKSKYRSATSYFLSLVYENFLSPSAVTIDKTIFEQAGGFDVDLPSAQDYEFWLRLGLSKNLHIEAIDKSLGYYCMRPGNITSNVQKRMECMHIIYHKFKPEILRQSPRPRLDLMRFKGRIYSVCGLRWLRQGSYVRGLYFILLGQMYWPRFDWVPKLFNKLR